MFDVALDLWIVVFSAAVGCYFAACHTALKTFSRKRLSDLLEERGKTSRLERTTEHIDGLLLMTGVGRAAVSITLVLGVLHYVSRTVSQWPQPWNYVLAFFLAGVLLGLFGVAIPTSWAAYRRERLLAWSLPVLHGLQILLWPITITLRFVDPVVRRISGVDLQKDDQAGITEEVLTVVEDRDDQSSVGQAQKQMLEAVLELPTTTAEEIMTPRTDVKGIEINATLDEVRAAIMDAGHSRMPVYDQSVDHIQGMVYAKDLIIYVGSWQPPTPPSPHVNGQAQANEAEPPSSRANPPASASNPPRAALAASQTAAGSMPEAGEAHKRAHAGERTPQPHENAEPADAEEPAFELDRLLRQPYMVPESKSVTELLSEFKAQKVHIAVVLDEYGGTAGLVTIEDILEEIVGEIQDEYEDAADQPPEIRPLDETSFAVEARVYIDDLNDAMGVELPEDEDYETVGGFVLSKLGHIPEQDESFTFETLRFTVTGAQPTRVEQVRIEKLESAQAEAQANGSSTGAQPSD